MQASSAYVQVLLPLPLGDTFTYSLPETLDGAVGVGSRVIVPFGAKKYYTGIVCAFVPDAPVGFAVKDIMHVLDPSPVIRYPQLKHWQWVATYYLCSVGEVYKAAVPSGLKIESETTFEPNPDFRPEDMAVLTDREIFVYNKLASEGRLSAAALEKATGFRNMPALVQRMVAKGVVIVSENLVDRYCAKKEKLVRIAFERYSDRALQDAFVAVRQAKKQEAMLQTLLHLSAFTVQGRDEQPVLQSDLLDRSGAPITVLKALEDKGLVQRYTREISRFRFSGTSTSRLPSLSPPQQQALSAIHNAFKDKPVTLLRGVTSSGKTEIYIHLIDYVLRQRMQVLYLVPEIALTTQLTRRLQMVFGSKVRIYHSKFTDNERVDIWRSLLDDSDSCVVIGARSAVFLPFAKLGLVIVDEEHDPSYKQIDPAPRYNGRDTAIMLAHFHGAKTLLGSATPSVETFYKALQGKYGLVELTVRYGDVPLPAIQIVDTATEYKRSGMRGSFAKATIRETRATVAEGHQAILFHNRRGFAPMARCKMCQYIPKCEFCDVSLTYHRRAHMLVCHYCGSAYPMPDICPACKEPAIEVVGYGTERVEDEVEDIFPEARILRMDLDTTRNKDGYQKLIDTFSSHKADILVGTQMVTKGLDFGDVTMVAVLNADAIINFPDFRSAERAFNMLEQVSGRAGRREQSGKVLIQTRSPEHPVISFVQRHDYRAFYDYEIREREAYNYPPFTRLVYIYLKHRDERQLDEIAALYAEHLRRLFGTRVSGPARPGVARVQSLYIRQIMLKIELAASMTKVKDILRSLHAQMHAAGRTRGLIIYYDVDPM